ncbi:MAG: hypothetical protein ABIF09_08285 [Gemmatimonadota bacterium]
MGWWEDRKEQAREYGELFVRRKVLRRLADEAAKALKEFTPAGLERFIASGLSIVGELEKAVPAERRDRYARESQEYRDVAATISDADVLEEIEKRAPEHALVLRRYPAWFSAELARIRQGLFPPLAIRTRAVALPGKKE